MIETFYCPICGKEATYHLNNTNWSWHHNCTEETLRGMSK